MLILYGDSNLIHLKYFYKDSEPKMIEGDDITVYGTFYYLYSYLTVAGTKKTIPSITAEFIDNHNVQQSDTSLKDEVESKAQVELTQDVNSTTQVEITTTQTESSSEEITTAQETTTSAPADFAFMGKVKNDVTGNWRWAKVSTDLEPLDYAIYYYKTYFNSNNEIHAIINSYSNTTIRVRYLSGLDMLDIGILNHIENEENDAKVLFSGDLIEQYQINLTTGEKIQEE